MKKLFLFTRWLLSTSTTALANMLWSAGSLYKDNINIPNDLSWALCQFFVSKIGKISVYEDSTGKPYNTHHPNLIECNKSAQ